MVAVSSQADDVVQRLRVLLNQGEALEKAIHAEINRNAEQEYDLIHAARYAGITTGYILSAVVDAGIAQRDSREAGRSGP